MKKMSHENFRIYSMSMVNSRGHIGLVNFPNLTFLRQGFNQSCFHVHPFLSNLIIVKIVFRGVPTFLIFVSIINSRYSLEPPRRAGSCVYPQSIF